jgi:phosphoenolpyruvate carboxylase
VKKEHERLERARIDKKIAEIQKEKGVASLKNFASIEELFNSTRNYQKSMNFSIDKKTNKDTFSTFSKLNKAIPKLQEPNGKLYNIIF